MDAPNAMGGRYGLRFLSSSFLRSPISSLLEYSGLLRPPPRDDESAIGGAGGGDGTLAIRIIGPADHEGAGDGAERGADRENVAGGGGAGAPPGSPGVSPEGEAAGEGAAGGGVALQRFDLQQLARWSEQVLPFSLLLLLVFIRQHLQGFIIAIGIAAVMFKSNDILRKQTALKGERRIFVLIGITILFCLHVAGFYLWYRSDDLLYPLFMLPPKTTPPFWHAIFIIVVNDMMVRQASMVLKCMLLMCCTNKRSRNYRKQGQMLTVVEYIFLLYRSLLPAPVWYRFFLNKEYGSFFSSLTTGLYLTFKFTSIIEKVKSVFITLKALSSAEVHYGSHATSEQVLAAGDLCAICQERMRTPVLLRCNHIFCEDCVSEWFERERTCPLCRALVRPAGLKSYSDGSTSLFFQFF